MAEKTKSGKLKKMATHLGQRKAFFGEVRVATPTEEKFFLTPRGTKIPAYAAPDNKVVFNPFVPLGPKAKKSLLVNERSRLLIREGQVPAPSFAPTKDQATRFHAYSDSNQDILDTIVSRAVAGDSSSGQLTSEQTHYVEKVLRPAYFKRFGKSFEGVSKVNGREN